MRSHFAEVYIQLSCMHITAQCDDFQWIQRLVIGLTFYQSDYFWPFCMNVI